MFLKILEASQAKRNLTVVGGRKCSFAACSPPVLLMETFHPPWNFQGNLADYPTLFNILGCTLILIENADGRRRAAGTIKTFTTADNFSYPPLEISSDASLDFHESLSSYTVKIPWYGNNSARIFAWPHWLHIYNRRVSNFHDVMSFSCEIWSL